MNPAANKPAIRMSVFASNPQKKNLTLIGREFCRENISSVARIQIIAVAFAFMALLTI